MAEARERRLLAKLNETSTNAKKRTEQPMLSPRDLGLELFDVLVSRDREAFSFLWHQPDVLAFEKGLSLAEAQDYVDGERGASVECWNQFDPGPPSERHPAGLKQVLSFVDLKMGPRKENTFSQNSLVLAVRSTRIEFSFSVPEIIVDKDGNYGLSSKINTNEAFKFFRELGFHLRPDILAPDAYWFPASVGNFWRYRLASREITRDVGLFERGLEDSNGATTKTVQIETIERFGTRRLVTFRTSYDDADETVVKEKWLMLPSAIYLCDTNCEATLDDLQELIPHLQSRSPLLVHPLAPGDSWSQNAFRVEGVDDVKVPMGRFDGVLRIAMDERVGLFDQNLFYAQKIWFKPSVGIVKRKVERESRPLEVLIEYRLMP